MRWVTVPTRAARFYQAFLTRVHASISESFRVQNVVARSRDRRDEVGGGRREEATPQAQPPPPAAAPPVLLHDRRARRGLGRGLGCQELVVPKCLPTVHKRVGYICQRNTHRAVPVAVRRVLAVDRVLGITEFRVCIFRLTRRCVPYRTRSSEGFHERHVPLHRRSAVGRAGGV